jgi:hypothetical protein
MTGDSLGDKLNAEHRGLGNGRLDWLFFGGQTLI